MREVRTVSNLWRGVADVPAIAVERLRMKSICVLNGRRSCSYFSLCRDADGANYIPVTFNAGVTLVTLSVMGEGKTWML
jgi:hypothetical protein